MTSEASFPDVVQYVASVTDPLSHHLPTIHSRPPKVIVNGNEQGPGRPGSFEVSTDDGVDLFSRLKLSAPLAIGTKAALPSPQGILDRIVNRAKVAELLAGTADPDNKPFCG